MIKLSVNETKWSSLLARTRALILYISIWTFDFGPEKLPGLSRNGPWTCTLEAPQVQVSPSSLAGFVLRSPGFKSSATLVNSAAWFASYQLWFFKPCYLSFKFVIIVILLFDSLSLKSPMRQGDDNYVYIYYLFFRKMAPPSRKKSFRL